jgi:hypothetical protein
MACQQGQQLTFQCLKARVRVIKLVMVTRGFRGDMHYGETKGTEKAGHNSPVYERSRDRKAAERSRRSKVTL